MVVTIGVAGCNNRIVAEYFLIATSFLFHALASLYAAIKNSAPATQGCQKCKSPPVYFPVSLEAGNRVDYFLSIGALILCVVVET